MRGSYTRAIWYQFPSMLDPYHYSHWSLYYRVHEDRNQYAIVSDTFQNLAACPIHLLPSPPLLSVLWNDNTMPYGGILLTVWRYTEICVTGQSIWVGFHSVLTCLSHFRSSMQPFIKKKVILICTMHSALVCFYFLSIFATLLSDIFLEEELVQPVCWGL